MKIKPPTPDRPPPVLFWSRPAKAEQPDTGLKRLKYESLCGRYVLEHCSSPHFGKYWLAVAVDATSGGQVPLKRSKGRAPCLKAVVIHDRINPISKSQFRKVRIMNAIATLKNETPITDAAKALIVRLEANHPLPVSVAKTQQRSAELLINHGIAELTKQGGLAVLRLSAAHAPKGKAEPTAKPAKHPNPRQAAQKMMKGRIAANKAKLAAGTVTKKELQDAAKTKVAEQLKIEGSAPVDILTMIPPVVSKKELETETKAAAKPGKGTGKKAEPKAAASNGKPAAAKGGADTAAAAIKRPAGVAADADCFDIYRREAGRAAALMSGRAVPHNATWHKGAKLLGQVWAKDRDAARDEGAKTFAEQLK